MGFSAGADDYIVKPFSNMELLMRVKAILRRSARGTAPAQEEKKSHIPFGDLILDLECQSVLRQGEVIVLTYTEFKILELLVTHKRRSILWKTFTKAFGKKMRWGIVLSWCISKYQKETGG